MSLPAKITERSLYPALMNVITRAGGTSVQEVEYRSVPDIVFELDGQQWLLSVKIGSSAKVLKDAMLQYWRHRDDSGIKQGTILFFPDSIRKLPPDEDLIQQFIDRQTTFALIDTQSIKEEFRDRPFPQVIDYLRERADWEASRPYSMRIVIDLLLQQVTDMMESIDLNNEHLLNIVTNRDLVMDLSHLSESQVQSVGRFLASYILMSQILFLRVFAHAQPHIIRLNTLKPISHSKLRQAFRRILDINYRQIYSVDILDSISPDDLHDIFDLIWGLEIENVRYELPGRIFHELMPPTIRKMLAAFYTRPLAADLLATLAITQSKTRVLDPACGSGTILVSAYKRKLGLWRAEHRIGNPHKRFLEEEIFGSDIMPFAVHLTTANLCAMDVPVEVAHTQVIQGDGLKLATGRSYDTGIQLEMFPQARTARTVKDDSVFEVELDKVDAVLMNPPFTKIERGIRRFVDMTRFEGRVGSEVGLWGHFIALANEFLDENGIWGGVIPINILRGRESDKVRRLLFEQWTPLYILKPVLNYAFSEWSEYRDVIIIARKGIPPADHVVKVALVKADLSRFSANDVAEIAETIRHTTTARTDKVDINSYPLDHLKSRLSNLMWFCSGVSLDDQACLTRFIEKTTAQLTQFPSNYFGEGFRPVPKGVSEFLFLTRHLNDSRVEAAELRFVSEGDANTIAATSSLGTRYFVDKAALEPSLRTGVGLNTMDISFKHDYIVTRPFEEFDRVLQITRKFDRESLFDWSAFWRRVETDVNRAKTNLVLVNRINPFSPSTNLSAFFSDSKLAVSNTLNIVREEEASTAKALCVLLNSVIFWSQFFLIKEESTGRYIHIRAHDMREMRLYPAHSTVSSLANVFERFRYEAFPSLSQQFDQAYDQRYDEFKERDNPQMRMFEFGNQEVDPSPVRLSFDRSVCEALGSQVTDEELRQVYGAFVREMMVVRQLKRD